MRKKIPVSMVIGLMMLAAVAAFNAAYVVIWNSFNDRLATLNAREATFLKLSEVAAYVDEYYAADYDPDAVLNGAAAGYIGSLPDGGSYYIPAEEARARDAADENGFTGIGIIGCQDRGHRGICVLGMYEGSTAGDSGIQAFDVITEVEGVRVAQLGYEGAMERIRGEEGTMVDLLVYRERTGETFRTSVRRCAVIVQRGFSYHLLQDHIGYILVDNFDRSTDSLFLEALNTLKGQGMQSLIVDLRLNPGGYMDVMTNMADPLMGEGTIYEEHHGNGEINIIVSNAEQLGLPVAVLISPYTVGAGEYFAAALQADGAAKLVGETTAGSGYVQSRIELSDGAVMVLTSAEYLTPRGASLEDTGVQPDVEVPMTAEERYTLYSSDEVEDPVLQAAVDLLR